MQNLSATQRSPQGSLKSAAQKIRLLVLDIDGTIAGQSNQISPSVLAAIQAVQAKGIAVAIATGRMYRSALRFHQAVGSTLPLTCYQGALIKDPKTELLHRHLPLPPTLAQELVSYLSQPELQSQLSVHLYIDDQLYVRELSPETLAYAERTGTKPIAVGDLHALLQTSPTKILALCHTPSLVDRLLEALGQRYTPAQLYLTRSVATFFEATHPAVSKGTAIRYLAEELLGLSAKNVMAIGDHWNDLEMLAYAGLGIAMGNAPEQVKAAAHWIAPSVEQDGAAAAITTFLL